ncbi:MAG TPA: hypothetical protein PK655_02070 [archaeon]|jgi:glyceraldehyde 3-phosphate dehydrogenase|nr:hypothetical protein [archaeon]
MKIGMCGFGRIGRQIFEALLKEKCIDTIFIYDPQLSKSNYDYLLQSELGQDYNKFKFKINKVKIISIENKFYNQIRDINILIECSEKIDLKKILHYNSKLKIITTYFYKDSDVKVALGYNNIKKDAQIISGLTCDTIAILPVLKTFLEFDILFLSIASIHPVLSYQKPLDNLYFVNKSIDLAKIRGFVNCAIPRDTSIANIIEIVCPNLKGKVFSYQLRIPTTEVTSAFITLSTKKKININTVKSKIKKNKYLCFNKDLKISSDFVKVSFSAVIDLRFFKVHENNCAFLMWYDNEYGYSQRIIDVVKEIGDGSEFNK